MAFEMEDRVTAAIELTRLAQGPNRWESCSPEEAQEGTWETFKFFLSQLNVRTIHDLRPEKK